MNLAGVNELTFEPKMPVAMDSANTTETPTGARPRMAHLAQLAFTPAELRYVVRLSQAPTQGAAVLRVIAGGTELYSADLSIVGNTVISETVPINTQDVAGETRLYVQMEVTTAADSGIEAQVDATLSVELPLTVAGC